MNKIVRWTCGLAVAVLMGAACSQPVVAQTFDLNSLKQQIADQKQKNKSNQNNSNQSNDDDKNNNSDNNANTQSGKRSKSSNQSSSQNGQQVQQFFPGSQNGQGQNNSGQNQFRRSNQQGNLQHNQQFQNWQQNNQNGLKIGAWNAGKWQGSHKIESWTKNFGGNQQPFSSKWYKDHPKAWKYNNNKANIWVTATVPGVYGWLGWGNVPQQYQGNYGNQPQFDPSYYGDWYPLGVWSLMAGPGDMGTRIVQLAVDRNGRIAGNYYDMISGSNYSMSGDIRQQSQRVSFWLNKNQFVRFRTSVDQLLQPYGALTVQLPGGEQQWQFVRLED